MAAITGQLALRSIRNAFSEDLTNDPGEDLYEDIAFKIEGRVFYGHKFFFCGRSEYFRALVSGNFKEGDVNDEDENGESIREIELHDVSAEAFAYVVDFIYTDNLNNAMAFVQELRRKRERYDNSTGEEKEWHLIYKVLQLSDMYMLPVLRHLCSVMLSQSIDLENLFDLIALEELMNLERLRDPLVQFMALHLEEILKERKDAFAELVR